MTETGKDLCPLAHTDNTHTIKQNIEKNKGRRGWATECVWAVCNLKNDN